MNQKINQTKGDNSNIKGSKIKGTSKLLKSKIKGFNFKEIIDNTNTKVDNPNTNSENLFFNTNAKGDNSNIKVDNLNTEGVNLFFNSKTKGDKLQ